MAGRVHSPAHRLFVAVELPAEARSLLAAWGEELPGLAWVREDQLHLTVRFIGAVKPVLRVRIEEAVFGFKVLPFEIALAGAGAFPQGAAPGVVWVGVREGAARLAELRTGIDARFEEAGVAREERPFHPHVTLARVRDPRAGDAVRGWLRRHADTAGPRLRVAGITLFRTHFDSGRAEHESIARSGVAPGLASGP